MPQLEVLLKQSFESFEALGLPQNSEETVGVERMFKDINKENVIVPF